MRMTVGPLPSSVYWRRRVLILGLIAVIVLTVSYACSGSDPQKVAQNNEAAAPASSEPTPSYSMLTPSGETSGPVVNDGGAVPAANPSTTPDPNGTASPCADTEIGLTPQPETPSVRQGVPAKLFIKIKNLSTRTCVRDVGADMQELYIQQGTVKQWSSDSCDARKGNDVVTFPPNHEVSYWLTWDGKSTAAGCANRAFLPKGAYQLFGRLGSKTSDPVTLTISA